MDSRYKIKLLQKTLIILAFALEFAMCFNSTAERLIANVDPTTPPMAEKTTFVGFDLDFKYVSQIKENKMHLAIALFEHTQWVDSRLAFQNLPNVTKYFRDSRLDISDFKNYIWVPKISYTEENDIQSISESIFLYPNGTISFNRYIILTITCQFNYENIPSDKHSCETVAYIQNEYNATGYMQWVDKFSESRNQKYLTWDIQMSCLGNVDVRWKTDNKGSSSGIRMVFNFERNPLFLSKLFVPSIILVVLAYTTFWIDQRKAPARVIYVITNILNSISQLVSTNTYIPQVPTQTWLQNFLIWNLIFTVVPMIQYAILNASQVSYDKRRKEIQDLVNELKAIASRTDNPLEPEELLHQARKQVAKQVRATITGGDVLQIEDFQIDLNRVNQSFKNRNRTGKNEKHQQASPQKNQEQSESSPEIKKPNFGFKKIMNAMQGYVEQQGYKEEIGIRIRKIVRKENSFLLGMTEVISLNFDFIFRYLYAVAFLLLMAVQYLSQMSQTSGYSFLAAVLIVAIIFIIALSITLLQYRMKASNLDKTKAFFFYIRCKCFKSKQLLENYD